MRRIRCWRWCRIRCAGQRWWPGAFPARKQPIDSTSSCRGPARRCSSIAEAGAAMTGTSTLLGPLATTEEMANAFNDAARLQGMLDFEAALARAEAEIGVIPATAAEEIARCCRAEMFDMAALGR